MIKDRHPGRGWQAAAGIGLALLAGCELAARIEDRVRWGTPLAARATRLQDLVVRDQDGMHGRSNARVQGFILNAAGTRGPEILVPKPAGTWRVVLGGASEVFGLTETPGREMARQLEDSLRAGCPGRNVEVVNAALPGMTLPTVIADLERRIPRLGPDLLVYSPTPAQYLADTLPRPAEPGTAPATLSPWRSRAWPRATRALRSLLPGALVGYASERAWERAGRRRPAGWRFDELPRDRLARFEADLRALVGAASGTGAGVVLMVHAHRGGLTGRDGKPDMLGWLRQVPRATPEVLVGFDSAAAMVTSAVAADSGITLIDPRVPLGAAGAAHFADHAHYTDTGAGVLAGVVARSLPAIPGC